MAPLERHRNAAPPCILCAQTQFLAPGALKMVDMALIPE